MKIIFILCIFRTLALIPSKLPNGNIKKYIPQTNINNEIVVVEPRVVSLISWNWMANILNYNSLNNEDLYSSPDLHIITKINELEGLYQDENEYVYIVWMPKCIYGSSDILFIIVCKLKEEEYNVLLVIQSPFWCPEQIESFKLKDALFNFTNNHIDLKELYDNDLRYKLSWSTWNLKSGN
tara:strand:+ start:788 stop:1330 length:543 start_codon:yes stop_codon:yes gene_type:complete